MSSLIRICFPWFEDFKRDYCASAELPFAFQASIFRTASVINLPEGGGADGRADTPAGGLCRTRVLATQCSGVTARGCTGARHFVSVFMFRRFYRYGPSL